MDGRLALSFPSEWVKVRTKEWEKEDAESVQSLEGENNWQKSIIKLLAPFRRSYFTSETFRMDLCFPKFTARVGASIAVQIPALRYRVVFDSFADSSLR